MQKTNKSYEQKSQLETSQKIDAVKSAENKRVSHTADNIQILIPIQTDELMERIRGALRAELAEMLKKGSGIDYEVPGMKQKPLYKASDVCIMLQISRQTLHVWVKEGLLKAYKIKSRLFFLWADLEALIKKQST